MERTGPVFLCDSNASIEPTPSLDVVLSFAKQFVWYMFELLSALFLDARQDSPLNGIRLYVTSTSTHKARTLSISPVCLVLEHQRLKVLQLQTRTARTGNMLYTEFETDASLLVPGHCGTENAVLPSNNQNQANLCKTLFIQVILRLFLGQLE